jgi:hypothetical protein
MPWQNAMAQTVKMGIWFVQTKGGIFPDEMIIL